MFQHCTGWPTKSDNLQTAGYNLLICLQYIGYAIYQEKKLNGNLIENGHVSMNYLRGLLPGTAIPVLGMAHGLHDLCT